MSGKKGKYKVDTRVAAIFWHWKEWSSNETERGIKENKKIQVKI